MMAIIEDIVDQYYFYSTEILQCFLGIFMIVVICGFVYTFLDDISRCWKGFIGSMRNKFHALNFEELHTNTSKARIRYNINKLIYKLVYSVIVAGIGTLLCHLGAKLEIEYIYFNAVVFMLIVGAIIAYGILLCLMFRQILSPMKQICKHIQFLTFLELFLLAITQHLDLLEWLTATLGIISAEVMIQLLEKQILEQKGNKEKKKNKGYDYPDSDLYPTRKRQLERFIAVLKEQRYEPYAVMISGEWGKGKTSFVQALEKALNESCFIWVCAGSEKNVSEIMSDISAQIVTILKENNIFLDRQDLIEKYFIAFSDLLEDTALKPLKKVVGAMLNKKSLDESKYLNSKLDELNKVIYLIVDDLDRCDSEYQSKMFKVIRESMELHNCKTIFLVDKTKFLTEKQDAYYIEKYVNYTLDLCEADYSEIVEFEIKDILDDAFIQNLNTTRLSDKSAEQIREEVRRFPMCLIEKIENEISTETESQQKKKDAELNRSKKKVEELQQLILRIKKDITVPRNVKNYLKGIKRDADAFKNWGDMIEGELLEEDWFGAIIKVQYVRSFMPEVFNDIKMKRNIFEFCRKYNGYAVDMIFDLKYGLLYHNEKQEALLDTIIYKIDVIDFSQVKTICERCLYELHNNQTSVKHIKEYIEFAQTYDDLNKILDLYEKQELNGGVTNYNFIEMIFNVLTQQSSSFKANTKDFLDFSQRFMECLVKKGMSDVEKITCVRASISVIDRTLADNKNEFIIVLSILFDITIVMEQWDNFLLRHIDGFYTVLKRIDKNAGVKELKDETNKLLSIEKYYKNLEIQLTDEKYKNVGLDLDGIFSRIKIAFDICRFWNGVRDYIDNSSDEETELFRKYFREEGYGLRIDMFVDASAFIEALEALKKFYTANENHYKSDYSLLLLRLSYRIIVQYESDPTWFADKKGEIAKLLEEVKELACRLDGLTGYDAQNTINEIKVYVYKFNEHYKEEIKETERAEEMEEAEETEKQNK